MDDKGIGRTNQKIQTMKEVQDKYIQIKGKVILLDDIDREQAYKLTIDGEIVDVREPTNDDGTVDRVYIFQVARAEVTDNLGKVTKTKDSRQASVKLRSIITHEWEAKGTEESKEDYYQKRMTGIMRGIIEGKI